MTKGQNENVKMDTNELIEGYKGVVKSLEKQLRREREEYKKERMESIEIISSLWDEVNKLRDKLKSLMTQGSDESSKIQKIADDSILLNSPRDVEIK